MDEVKACGHLMREIRHNLELGHSIEHAIERKNVRKAVEILAGQVDRSRMDRKHRRSIDVYRRNRLFTIKKKASALEKQLALNS